MPPKADPDVKLEQMRSYVAAHVAELASSKKATLKDMFAAQTNSDEASFYFFCGRNSRTSQMLSERMRTRRWRL